MKTTVLQPPYPALPTVAAATACLAWQQDQLTALAPGDCDLILLPEYANCPGLDQGTPKALRQFISDQGQVFLAHLANEARRLHSRLAVGALVMENEILRNRTLIFGPDGRVAAYYDKTHLPAAEEALGVRAGVVPVVAEVAGIRFGFFVCFDIYFPEFTEALAALRPNVLLAPSYQRSETPERIRLLAQARALDSGAGVVRSSYATGHAERGGHSLVTDASGKIIADAGSEPGVLRVVMDPKARFLKPASHGQPLIEHRALIAARRRPALYRPGTDYRQALLASPLPWVCAHRGLNTVCPENTLPSFGAAQAIGAHEIEFDLWLSADGRAVVCHDPDLSRTTDMRGTITEMTWNDIRRADAGIRLSEAWQGIRVPCLEEVLELTAGRIGLNIHIKDPGPEAKLVRHVCDHIRAQGLLEVAYIAGEENVLEAARAYAPEIARDCLAGAQHPERMLELALQYGCRRAQFQKNVTDTVLREARGAGILCNLFYANDPEEAHQYVKRGIDVILTDNAHRLFAQGFVPRSLPLVGCRKPSHS